MIDRYSIGRRISDGRWAVADMEAPIQANPVYIHTSRAACETWVANALKPEPTPADLPPPHAALARVEAMQNELIALHVNTWGAYEVPRYGIDARVRHKPTGKLCRVRGYMAWTPPIVLYSLTEVDGEQLPDLTPLSDIEAVTAHNGELTQCDGPDSYE
jgi:hypothetical protein